MYSMPLFLRSRVTITSWPGEGDADRESAMTPMLPAAGALGLAFFGKCRFKIPAKWPETFFVHHEGASAFFTDTVSRRKAWSRFHSLALSIRAFASSAPT